MSENSSIEIDVQATSQLLQKHSSEEFLLLDCREPDEHKACRIEGSKLIPMRLVPDRLEELEPWKLSLIHIPSPRDQRGSRMPSSA